MRTQVLPKEAQPGKLLEVATDLETDTTVKDWRAQYRRSFEKYLKPLLVPGRQVLFEKGNFVQTVSQA